MFFFSPAAILIKQLLLTKDLTAPDMITTQACPSQEHLKPQKQLVILNEATPF